MKKLLFLLLIVSNYSYGQGRILITDSLRVGSATIGAISSDTALGSSNKILPTQKAVKDFVANSGLFKVDVNTYANDANSYFDDGGTTKTGVAYRIGNVVSGLLDPNTGEYITYTKRLINLRTGVTITDADVDGVIIRKKNGEYFVLNYTGPISLRRYNKNLQKAINSAASEILLDDTTAVNYALNCNKKTLRFTNGAYIYGTGTLSNFRLVDDTKCFDVDFKLRQIYTPDNYVRPEWFTLIEGTKTSPAETVNTKSIQKAVNIQTYFQTGTAASKVKVPIGTYYVNNTIHGGYGISGFTTTRIEGGGEGVAFGDTRIIGDFDDRPIINFQGQRYFTLSNIIIEGIYQFNYTDYLHMRDKNYYINGGSTTPRTQWDNRYAVYAAVTVDGYSGAKPTGSAGTATQPYPDVIYDADVLEYTGHVGYTTQYNKTFTSTGTFEHVKAIRCVAGFVINPSQLGSQGDYINWNESRVEECVYGFSGGAPNARQLNLTNTNAFFVWSVINTTVHGQQQGQFGLVTGCEFSYVYQWMDINTSFGSTTAFLGTYGEGISRIGKHSNIYYGSTGLTFEKCHWFFTHSNAEMQQDFEDILTGNMSYFKNCQFYGYTVLTIHGSANFDGCLGQPVLATKELGAGPGVPVWYSNFLRYNTAAIVCYEGKKTGDVFGVVPDLNGFDNPQTNDVLGQFNSTFSIQAPYDGTNKKYKYITDITNYIGSNSNNLVRSGVSTFPVKMQLNIVENYNFVNFTITGRTLSGTFRTTDNLIGVQLGSVMLHQNNGQMNVFVITALNTTTLDFTGLLYNNFYRLPTTSFDGYATSIDNTGFGTSLTTNSLRLDIIPNKKWVSHQAIYGDLIAGNATIQNVVYEDGTSAAGFFDVDDNIISGQAYIQSFNPELSVPQSLFTSPARVLSKTSTTITMNKTAAISAVGVRLTNVIY